MWDMNRQTKHSCHIFYTNKKSSPCYPLSILKRMHLLDKALMEYGLSGLEVCGSKIVIKDAAQEIVFRSKNDCGPWKNTIVTRMYGDKGSVISAMCVLATLWEEDYIEQCGVSKLEGENKELWETAWSIILSMKEDKDEDAEHIYE